MMDSDSSSISSYVTAPEEPIVDDDNHMKHKKYYKELIKEYGRSPGKVYVHKPKVEYKIKLPYPSAQLFINQAYREAIVAMVEQFSGAQTRILRDKYRYTMSIQGSVEQEELTKLMIHAILCDNVYGTHFYVTLKLNGEHFRERAQNLYDTMTKIVPNPDRLVRTDNLHVTVAQFHITNDVDRKQLLKIVTDVGNELRQTITQDPMIGYFNTATVTEGFIGAVASKEYGNNIGRIRGKY
ncbi:hypothetical protein BDC45DRAFT_502998 [Circinella umbellata]|nr:hypothetical protein BDC45DRAFT_502998 [Circinella umbellata]